MALSIQYFANNSNVDFVLYDCAIAIVGFLLNLTVIEAAKASFMNDKNSLSSISLYFAFFGHFPPLRFKRNVPRDPKELTQEFTIAKSSKLIFFFGMGVIYVCHNLFRSNLL